MVTPDEILRQDNKEKIQTEQTPITRVGVRSPKNSQEYLMLMRLVNTEIHDTFKISKLH